MKAKMDVPAAEVFGSRKAAREPVQISVMVPKKVQKNMRVDMTTRGYGLKEKSIWMKDTLDAFLDTEYWRSKRYIPDREEDEEATQPEEDPDSSWQRIVVDSECMRVMEPVKEWFKLDPETLDRALAAAIRSAYYGLHQDPPLILDLSASSVLRTAILWRIGQAGSAGG